MRAPRITSVTRVVGVVPIAASTRFDQIVLATPKSDVVVRCDPDTDEVVISRQKKRKRDGVIIASGRFSVPWTWLLVNQQGYTDGFRIQLEARGITRVFDFLAMASSIEVQEAGKPEANQSAETTAVKCPPSNHDSGPAVSHL